MRIVSARLRLLLAAAALVCVACVTSVPAAELARITPVDLYQVSTIKALSAGLYQGQTRLSEVARHGNFGLGTLDGLDGELIVLDGIFYHAASDGSVRVPPPAATTPFAQVVFFRGNLPLGRVDGLDLAGLKSALTARLPDPSRFYAVRVQGTFASLTARSAPAPKKPWPPLAEALKSQSLFPLRQVGGTIVGIYAPASVPGLAPAGWHFHFLSADRRHGGHVLKAQVATAVATGDVVRVLTVRYPDQALPRWDVGALPPGLE